MLGTPYPPLYVAQCEGLHFLSSACAGLLAYCLMLTISYMAWPALATSRRWWLPRSFAWSCSLCAALAMHLYADLAGLGF